MNDGKGAIFKFEELKVWQKAVIFAENVIKIEEIMRF